MQQIDALIKARWIIPVVPENTVLEHHAIAVRNGSIIDILPAEQAGARYSPLRTHELKDHALIPGLINAHTHSPMSLFRGMADDMSLMQWLQEKIWPAEGKWVNTQFVREGAQFAIAEMILGGTTCFADMYFFPDQIAEAAQIAGIRACVGLIVLDFPTVWANNADDYIHKGVALHDTLKHKPLLHTMFAPHAPYTVSDEPLKRVRTLADELDIPIMCHVHETAFEVSDAAAKTGQRPLARLHKLGLLTPSLLAVHMTQLTADEIGLVADNGVHVIHCPESNMKLASGYCPVQALRQAGANVALGTDGAASNNDLDMFGEMRSAALLAKNVAGDATALPAFQALKMATLNGAQALGIAQQTGSLERGKSADIVAVNLSHINTRPVYDPISQIVYAAGSHQVSDVWVGGRQLLQNRRLTTLDLDSLLDGADNWRNKIASI
ncbi:MAG TPA: TRZ/ATZ family hydrolase [Gammaproteobacteria bacterium]|nr:TRZ/ATZ family hydrolase [Gammaproteobacteria bacterium]